MKYLLQCAYWTLNAEPEGLHCPRIYTFIHRIICWKQIINRNTWTTLMIEIQGKRILAYNKGKYEV